jgi:hypothetical protein
MLYLSNEKILFITNKHFYKRDRERLYIGIFPICCLLIVGDNKVEVTYAGYRTGNDLPGNTKGSFCGSLYPTIGYTANLIDLTVAEQRGLTLFSPGRALTISLGGSGRKHEQHRACG